ncbi:DUF2635 domain-containing protein [Pseudomonas anguilliseptica]|uniref:DUF2635 domain-containing protein n=1 Tax=Pseudomonas anguilliseptica TaxID=53406 RepID=UPI003D331290
MFVKPAPGCVVTDPATGRPLPAKGAEVPKTQFWLRRREVGDVVDATPKTRKPAQ